MAIISSKSSAREPEKPYKASKVAKKGKSGKNEKKGDRDNLVEAEATPEERQDVKHEEKIRPQKLSEYIGQTELKEVLSIAEVFTKFVFEENQELSDITPDKEELIEEGFFMEDK